MINNIFYNSSLKTNSKGQKDLLSVTVIDDQNLSAGQLVNQVRNELKNYCGIDAGRMLKQYFIPRALPKLQDLKHAVLPTATLLKNNVFLAGDSMLNGSLNAAISSGESAALGVVETWSKNNG